MLAWRSRTAGSAGPAVIGEGEYFAASGGLGKTGPAAFFLPGRRRAFAVASWISDVVGAGFKPALFGSRRFEASRGGAENAEQAPLRDLRVSA